MHIQRPPRGQAWPWVRCLPLITCFFIYRRDTGYLGGGAIVLFIVNFSSVELIFWTTATHHRAESLLSGHYQMSFRGAGPVKYNLSDIKPKRHFFKKYQSKDESFGSCLKKTNWNIVISRGIVNGLGKNSLKKLQPLNWKFFLEKSQKAKVK